MTLLPLVTYIVPHSFTFGHSFTLMSITTPQVRRRPTKLMSRVGPESNLVRASVLEAALELGITQSSTVANWIFNSPLIEESDELEHISPEIEPEEVR